MMKMTPVMRRHLLFVALIALAPMSSAIQLVEPQNATTLRGGSFATIEWRASELPAHAEEWEAFLSLDGGKYYAFRITPHLDLDVRRFTWIVPNVDTNNARLLIRTGDEHRETLFEFPARFSIARDARAELPLVPTLTIGHAEAARDGDPDVVGWADGDRAGARVQQQCSRADGRRIVATIRHGARSNDVVLAPKIVRRSIASFVARVVSRQSVAIDPALPSSDVLLVTSRLNV